MPPSQTVAISALVVAPLAVVVEAARDVATMGLRLGPAGVTRGLLADGDVVMLRPARFRRAVVARVDIRPAGLVVTVSDGRWRGLRYRQSFRETGAGTLVVDEVRWRSSPLLNETLLRPWALRLLRRRSRLIADLVDRRVRLVVGAALIRDGRVLAAQRAEPRAYAGRWELPGGKVEAAESGHDALRRECREELGVDIDIGARVGPDLVIGGTAVLRVWAARPLGEPAAHEHSALRWLAATELDTVDWLPADRVLLPELRGLLQPRAPHDSGAG